MTNKEILKKQILYRSSHRGSKEMDLLLGKFVKKNINTLTESELRDLKNLVNIEDDILQKWFFYNGESKLIQDNKITQMLKKFRL